MFSRLSRAAGRHLSSAKRRHFASSSTSARTRMGAATFVGGAGVVSAAFAASMLSVVPVNAAEEDDSNESDEDGRDAQTTQSLYVEPCTDSSNYHIFSGNGNPALAMEVASRLGTQLGRATVTKFADGELNVRIHDNVRGKNVYIIQPTCYPANDNLMELLLMIATLKRASAERVVAVVPYFSYARQLDRQDERSTIPGSDVALLLETAGVDHVIAVDLHRGQVQGFFNCPVENLDTTQSALPYFLKKIKSEQKVTVVSPASSGVGRATKFRDELCKHGVDANLALLYVEDKSGFMDSESEHHFPIPDENLMNVVGAVKGTDCIIVDDMIDTGSRITHAAAALRRSGAKRVYAYTSHGLLTGNAVEKLNASELDEVVIFNTVPLPMDKWSPVLRQLSVGGLIAQAITRHSENKSFAALF